MFAEQFFENKLLLEPSCLYAVSYIEAECFLGCTATARRMYLYLERKHKTDDAPPSHTQFNHA